QEKRRIDRIRQRAAENELATVDRLLRVLEVGSAKGRALGRVVRHDVIEEEIVHDRYVAEKCGFSMSPIRFPNGSATVATLIPSPTSWTGDVSVAPARVNCSTAWAASGTPQ